MIVRLPCITIFSVQNNKLTVCIIYFKIQMLFFNALLAIYNERDNENHYSPTSLQAHHKKIATEVSKKLSDKWTFDFVEKT